MNCQPPKHTGRAAQMQTVFIALLFLPSFVGALSMVAYTVWRYQCLLLSIVKKKSQLQSFYAVQILCLTCLVVWSPPSTVGPSRVLKPPSTPSSVGRFIFRTFQELTGPGGYLKTCWEANSSTIWWLSSSCTSEIKCLQWFHFYVQNFFWRTAVSHFAFLLLSESSFIFFGKSLRDGKSSSGIYGSRLWMWVLISYELCSLHPLYLSLKIKNWGK